MPIPPGLEQIGTHDRPFEPIGTIDDLPPGEMRRVTVGDLDLLVVHTDRGICVTDDRCPHMSAPLSFGVLEGCEVACPLHSGKFDLATGEVIRFPTTGGLDADGNYHPPWTPPDVPLKPEPTDLKARARASTRVRRMRFYPVRLSGHVIEARLPG